MEDADELWDEYRDVLANELSLCVAQHLEGRAISVQDLPDVTLVSRNRYKRHGPCVDVLGGFEGELALLLLEFPYLLDALLQLINLEPAYFEQEAVIDGEQFQAAGVHIRERIELFLEVAQVAGDGTAHLPQFESVGVLLLQLLPELHVFGAGGQHAYPKVRQALVEIIEPLER